MSTNTSPRSVSDFEKDKFDQFTPSSSKTGSNLLDVNGEERSSIRNSGGDYILLLQQENEALKREIDQKESKLQVSMNSIKNFWSPELKKERALRKEENNKIVALQEELKAANEEKLLTVQALQDELCAQRDLHQLLQDDHASSHRQDGISDFSGLGSFSVDSRMLQEESDRLSRENDLLRQTMVEYETRIDAQRQTLETRDESVRKLLEMLQVKGVNRPGDLDAETSVEIDALRVQVADYESRLTHMDMLLHEKNRELQTIRQTGMHQDGFEENSKLATMQSLLAIKETKIASLERIIGDLEEDLNKMRHDVSMSSTARQEELKQLDAYKNHTNFMKAKIEQLKSDVQKRETEMLTLQTRLDTMNNQQSDNRQHIDVLKESLAAKEQGAAILQSEVDSLRSRLDEKQQMLDQKQDQLTQLQEERSSSGSELSHLRDTLDVKDRKITVLHKKIESLMEVVREKDRELEATKDRMSSLQQDSSSFDCNISAMEEALAKKDEEVQCLRSEKTKMEEKFANDLEEMKKVKRKQDKRLEILESDLNERDTNLSEVKEKASSLASSALKKDSKMKQLEIFLQEKTEEVARLEAQLKKNVEENEETKAQHLNMLAKAKDENKEKAEELERVMKEKSEESTKFQGELDRLLEILKETENEKYAKDKRISILEKQVEEKNIEIKSLKAKMVEEVKRKGAAQDKDMANLLLQLKSNEERVEELEVALRESVSIIAEREDVLNKEEEGRQKLEKQMEELVIQFEKTKTILSETGNKLASSEASLHEKERYIQQLRSERMKQMEATLEMKQEALLAAISEKDANIALLELSQSRKKANAEEVCMLRREKDELVQQLKQQTQIRLKLMQENNDGMTGSPINQRRAQGNTTRLEPQDEGDGIWA